MRLIYTILIAASLNTKAPMPKIMNSLLGETRAMLDVDNLTPGKRIRLAKAYIEGFICYTKFLKKSELMDKMVGAEAFVEEIHKVDLKLLTLIQTKQYDVVANFSYLVISGALNVSRQNQKSIDLLPRNLYTCLTVLLDFQPIQFTYFTNPVKILENLNEEFGKRIFEIEQIVDKMEKLNIDTSFIDKKISKEQDFQAPEGSIYSPMIGILWMIKKIENIKKDLNAKLKEIYPNKEATPQVLDELFKDELLRQKQEKLHSARERLKNVPLAEIDIVITMMEIKLQGASKAEKPLLTLTLQTLREEKQAREAAKLKEVALPATAAKVEMPQTKPSDFIPICERKRRLEQMPPYAKACHVDVEADTDADFEEVEVRGAQSAVAKVVEFTKTAVAKLAGFTNAAVSKMVVAKPAEDASVVKIAPKKPDIIEMLEDMVKRKATYQNNRVIQALENFGKVIGRDGSARSIIIQHSETQVPIVGWIHERHGKGNDTFAAATWETKLLINLMERAGYWPWPYS